MSKKTADKLTRRREDNWEAENNFDRWDATPKELIAAYKGGMRDFSGVRVTDTPDHPLAFSSDSFEDASFYYADFKRCDLSQVSFKGCNVSNAQFNQAELYQVNFEGANCEYTTFDRASLCSANLKGAKCLHADFEAANVAFADFREADLQLTSWHYSQLSTTDFRGARLNWASHWLLSYILWEYANTAARQWAASFVRFNTHLCWPDFTEPRNLPEQLRPELPWALDVLSRWVDPNTYPDWYPSAVLNAAQRRWDMERAKDAPQDEGATEQPPSN